MTLTNTLPKSDIPNTGGFRLRAILKDGRRRKVIVQVRRHSWTHYIRGVKYGEMIGWEPL